MRSTRILMAAAFVFSVIFFVQNGSLFSIVLVSGIIAVTILSWITVMTTGKKMSIDIRAAGNVQKGSPVSVYVDLKNTSRLPIYRLKGSIICENILTGESCSQQLIMNAGPEGSMTEGIQLDEKYCGYIHISVSDIRICDMLMLFQKRREKSAEAGTYVMPQIQPITVDEHLINAYNMESYQYSSLKKGNDPSETFGIREYIEGDSPKTIHWKLTGKTGDLVVRELGLPVENSILLLMDKRVLEGEVLDAEIRASAAELFLSLSHSLLEKGIGHSVAWMDYRKGNFIMRHIENQQELWAITANLMESPYREDRLSTPVRYLEYGGNQKFATYFYVTAGTEPDEIRLEDQGAVKVYRAEEFK